MATKKMQILTPIVTSINERSGNVVLTANDIGALPDSTVYVSSVNGESGDVSFDYVSSVNGQSGSVNVQPVITGAATSITDDDLEVGKVLISDDNGKITTSSVTVENINVIGAIAKDLQSQIDAKADKVNGAMSGNFAGLDSNGNLTDSGSNASDFATASHNHDDVYSTKSTIMVRTLSSDAWNGEETPYTITLAVVGVTSTSNQEILPGIDITAEELESMQNANIQDGGQATNSITLKAFGDKPEIDIPVRIILRGDS